MLVTKRVAKNIYDAYECDLIEESGKIDGFDLITNEQIPYLEQIIGCQSYRKGYAFISRQYFKDQDFYYYRVQCPTEWFKEGVFGFE